MAAARSIMSRPTRFLPSNRIPRPGVFIGGHDHTRSPPFRCNHSSSSPATIQDKTSDKWVPPQIIVGIPLDTFALDIGQWIVQLHRPSNLRKFSDREAFALSVKVLAEAVGSLEEAKKRIYLISCDPECLGFGAHIDRKIVDKLRGTGNVRIALPDYYSEARENDPDIRLLTVNESSSDSNQLGGTTLPLELNESS